MADWVRRPFRSAGLTQVPPGRYLGHVQDRFGGGVVMLCIDVSGSMDGRPVLEAIRGAKKFVREAVTARYKVGVMLWNTQVVDCSEPTADGKQALRTLAPVKHASGGNHLIGPLERCHQILDRFRDDPDRVVALFGDGDLTPREPVLGKVAQMKAENIRFVTRGLGAFAAREFGTISSEEPSTAVISDVTGMADGIAGMATSLRPRGLAG